MNYSSKKEDKRLLFSISKSREQKNCFVGWFMYSSDKIQYLSTNIIEKDELKLMHKLLFCANREISQSFYVNIEDMVDEIWNEYFNSKTKKLFDSIPHHILVQEFLI